MENDLLVLESASVGEGFRILNSLTAGVKLVDAEPIGQGHFLIVARGELASLKAFAQAQTSTSISTEFEIIESARQEILNAAYSLAPTKLEGSLVVLETASVPLMFLLAQSFAGHGLIALEIKIRKGAPGGSYAYFCGAKAACLTAAGEARTRLAQRMQTGLVEVLDQPNEHVRSLFGI